MPLTPDTPYFSLLFPSEIEEELESEGKVQALSVTESEGGEVGIPDQSLTKSMIINTKSSNEFIKEWIDHYDFHFVQDFQIDINPNQGFNPEWVRIQGTMNSDMPVLERPIVSHVFPTTQFVDANWKLEGEFTASASVGFEKQELFDAKFGAGIEGEAKFSFKYNPMIAQIDSGTSGSAFHWNFREANGKKPIGGLDIKMIIIRPRKVKELQVVWEVAVKFGKRFRGSDLARATGNTSLRFQES